MIIFFKFLPTVRQPLAYEQLFFFSSIISKVADASMPAE